ncbi:beta-galactosidase [Microbacterium kyungheense]|uniref:Glycosyl hydrolase family 35 n=1 Tax=Microbacterium kyungheense TaxID=1263636 RepID=A0A543EUJ6_9MICO|nr:beta-galactosidase [Microbacterium kyungheense]TQM25248.1 glycosyl hydrolase family 35 [Microbacterium kyungheense]
MTRLLHLDATVPARDERRPRMANDEDVRRGLGITSRCLFRDGRPWLPVSGELHYSRVPRERWTERLRLMRAGGITVVATYVLWLHHEPVRGEASFDGGLDVAAFVDAARAEGLEVVLRIGPWAHGEARNGGFPDWVQQAPVAHRTDDPAYLALVAEWFGRLARALGDRGRPDVLLGIQLENELYDQPGHLVTLKRLAREAGLSAPLWTATAWGGAQLPDPEVLPLWGGYGDGFWVDPGEPWDRTFRAHFFFSDTWDDPGIGADVRETDAASAGRAPAATRSAELSPWFPAATCELGGGMATAYHRRPRPDALDIAAVAHAKLGSGSAWQGYYMYTGGTNPGPDLEETQATGYPNDLTPRSYDFHAPIGEAGRTSPTHAALRGQHAFIAAFGERLAPMPSHLPDVRPHGVEDAETLRWAVRADGGSGFVFIGRHQPHVPLPTYRGARLRVATTHGTVELPSAPVDIPAGTLARWPLGLEVEGVTIEWATATALTVLPGAVPTLVLAEDAGIPVEIAHEGVVHPVTPGADPLRLAGALDVLVLTAADAADAWVVESGERRLLVSPDEVTWDAAGALSVRSGAGRPDVREYAAGAWRSLGLELSDGAGLEASCFVRTVREASVPSGDYGSRDGRQGAPRDEVLDAHAAVFAIDLAPHTDDAVLRVRWAGDVLQLRVDGETTTDRFWDGSEFVVSLRDAGVGPGSRVELRILPLRADSGVHLPDDAAARLAAATETLCALDDVTIEQRALWRETATGREPKETLR